MWWLPRIRSSNPNFFNNLHKSSNEMFASDVPRSIWTSSLSYLLMADSLTGERPNVTNYIIYPLMQGHDVPCPYVKKVRLPVLAHTKICSLFSAKSKHRFRIHEEINVKKINAYKNIKIDLFNMNVSHPGRIFFFLRIGSNSDPVIMNFGELPCIFRQDRFGI